MVRGRDKVGVVGIFVVITLIFVALITVLAVILVGQSVGGVVVFIVYPVLRLEERAPISVSNVKAFWIAARETMNAVDDVLWEGGGSETLTV